MVLSNTDIPNATIAANNKPARKTFMALLQDSLYSAGMVRGVFPDGTWPFACSSLTQSG
jgi:hypothetical protein